MHGNVILLKDLSDETNKKVNKYFVFIRIKLLWLKLINFVFFYFSYHFSVNYTKTVNNITIINIAHYNKYKYYIM